MPKIQAAEVQVTLPDGKVLHFLASEGDTINFSRTDTYTGPKFGENSLTYFSIHITPGEGNDACEIAKG